jgi:hypothetical protein
MKKIKLIVIIVFCSIIGYGQTKEKTTKSIEKYSTQVPTQISVNFPDSIQIKDVSKKADNQTWIDKNLPWIIAFIIGLLSALVNFWIAYRLRLSNERNLLNQIQSNERNVKAQIESVKEAKLIEFKATIAAKNRQEWVNDVRHTLAEYLASTSLDAPLPENPSPSLIEQKKDYVQRMALAKARLELLLNRDKPEQAELLDKIENMLRVSISVTKDTYVSQIQIAKTDVIIAARKLFVIHWNKIKELK